MTLHTPQHARFRPYTMPLAEALERIDKVFGIEKILADEGVDILQPYYRQSEFGYKRVHSQKGCMHVALNTDGVYDIDGYFTQTREVTAHIGHTGASQVLELGSGMGFNTLTLAPQHTNVAFTGVDLIDHHVATAQKGAKGMANARFVQGSYQDLPEGMPEAEVIFAIETLCYATDLDQVAQQVAQHLKPGGRFIMYDGFRRPDFDQAPADVILATRLFEVTTAVTGGFWTLKAWEDALTRAGLSMVKVGDHTDDTIACMRYLQDRSARFFRSIKYKFLRPIMPKYLIRNAVGGLTGPYMIEGADPLAGQDRGALTYNVMIAEKPA
jgi:arsenite methyltransferase